MSDTKNEDAFSQGMLGLVGVIVVGTILATLLPTIVLGLLFSTILYVFWRYSYFPKTAYSIGLFGSLLSLNFIFEWWARELFSLYGLHPKSLEIYDKFIAGKEELSMIYGPFFLAIGLSVFKIYKNKEEKTNSSISKIIEKSSQIISFPVFYSSVHAWRAVGMRIIPQGFFVFATLMLSLFAIMLGLNKFLGLSSLNSDHVATILLLIFILRAMYLFTTSVIDVFFDVLPSQKGKGFVRIGKVIGKSRRLHLDWPDVNHHIHILGQSGAGKSVLLRNFYSSIIASNRGLVMIDLKADADVVGEISSYACLSEREHDLHIIDLNYPEKSAGYNPLLRGNGSELKDKIINSLDWSEIHYKKISERILLTLMRAVEHMREIEGEILTLKDVVYGIKNPDALLTLAKSIEGELKNDLVSLSKELRSKDMQKSLSGLTTDLEIMVKSQFGSILSKDKSIDLLDIIRENKILYILLDSQKYSDTAIRLAKMIISDIRSASGEISASYHDKNHNCTVIIDEFADIVSNENAAKSFAGFLNRARSSNIGIIMAHQSLGDFADERAKKQILDNTETVISFVQKDPETCETLASIAGTHKVEEKTKVFDTDFWGDKETGRGSIKEVEEFLVHPNIFKNLSTGQAVYIAKKPSRLAMLDIEMRKVPSGNLTQHDFKKIFSRNVESGTYIGEYSLEVEHLNKEVSRAITSSHKAKDIIPSDFQI